MFGRETVLDATRDGILAMRRSKRRSLDRLQKVDKLGLTYVIGIAMWE